MHSITVQNFVILMIIQKVMCFNAYIKCFASCIFLQLKQEAVRVN